MYLLELRYHNLEDFVNRVLRATWYYRYKHDCKHELVVYKVKSEMSNKQLKYFQPCRIRNRNVIEKIMEVKYPPALIEIPLLTDLKLLSHHTYGGFADHLVYEISDNLFSDDTKRIIEFMLNYEQYCYSREMYLSREEILECLRDSLSVFSSL